MVSFHFDLDKKFWINLTDIKNSMISVWGSIRGWQDKHYFIFPKCPNNCNFKDSTNLSLTLRHAHTLSIHLHWKSIKASKKEFLLWTKRAFVEMHRQTESQTGPVLRWYILQSVKSLQVPCFLVMEGGLVVKPISWQGHEIQYRAFVPRPLLPASLKITHPVRFQFLLFSDNRMQESDQSSNMFEPLKKKNV